MIGNNVKCLKYMKLIYAFPFCRPRKGNNVVNCFVLMHDSVHSRKHLRIEMVAELQKSELHIRLVRVLSQIMFSES